MRGIAYGAGILLILCCWDGWFVHKSSQASANDCRDESRHAGCARRTLSPVAAIETEPAAANPRRLPVRPTQFRIKLGTGGLSE